MTGLGVGFPEYIYMMWRCGKRGVPVKMLQSWWGWGRREDREAQSAQRKAGSTWKVSLSQIVCFWLLPGSNVSCLDRSKGKL